jgi:protein O-GlcNAc transferase
MDKIIDEALKQGVDAHQAGQIQEADRYFTAILKANPKHPQANFNMGLLGISLGKLEATLPFFERAIKGNPNSENYWFRYIQTLIDSGKVNRAKDVLREARPYCKNLNILEHFEIQLNDIYQRDSQRVSVDPPESILNNLLQLFSSGNFLKSIEQAGQLLNQFPHSATLFNIQGAAFASINQHEKAIEQYQKAIKLDPNYTDALNNLGVALTQTKRSVEAVKTLRRAVDIRPEFSEAHYNLGNALRDSGETDKSIKSFLNALELDPSYLDARNNLGNALKDKGDLDDAEICFRQALQIDSNSSDAYVNLGVLMQQKGDLNAAMLNFQEALGIKPSHKAYNNIGNIKHLNSDFYGALANYEKALEVNPNYAQVHDNMGIVREDMGELILALECYRKALKFQPDLIKTISQMLHLRSKICDWSELKTEDELMFMIGLSGDSVIPFCMLPLDDAPSRQNKRAELYAQQRFTNNPLPPILRPNKPPSRLRIGYFSADFYDHTVTHLICRMLELHDTEKFEIYAYSFSPKKEDAMRMKVIDAVDSFRDIHDMSDMDAAMLAREDKIDIAVDLTGYTKNCRSGIFAYHAAPIQINYLGYPGTMGADFMDYIITDQILVPEDSRQYLSEKVIQMPYSYMVTNNTREVSAREITRSEMGLPEDGFVFCVFNNSYKISPREFDIWTRLLLKVEGSVLWMRHSNKWADENLRKEAQKRDIDPDRLVFAERVPLDEHLARHQLADLFLDTFTFNAHSTAVDALWAGLPVLTKLGYSFAARVAGSLLSAVGMEDLITNTEQEYEDLALELASDPDKLNQLRQKLDTNRLTTPLFDTEQFTKYLENGYQQAYQIYSKGDNTDNIVIKH